MRLHPSDSQTTSLDRARGQGEAPLGAHERFSPAETLVLDAPAGAIEADIATGSRPGSVAGGVLHPHPAPRQDSVAFAAPAAG